MPEFMKIPEVAERLRVHPITVRRWIRSGQLPAAKVGGSYRIPTVAVEVFAAPVEAKS